MTEPATAPSTTRRRPSERITAEVTSWPGVEAGPGRRGEFAFKVGRREIGHLHGDRSAHFVFPRDVWTELHAQGRVVHHPVFPDREGPAARRIETDEDVRDVIALMRLNYERAVGREDGTEPNESRGTKAPVSSRSSTACARPHPRRCRSRRRCASGPSCSSARAATCSSIRLPASTATPAPSAISAAWRATT